MTEAAAKEIGIRVGAVSVCTTLLPAFAFALLLHELEPAPISTGAFAARLLAQALAACAMGIALARALATPTLDALADPEADAVSGLAAAHRLPALFTVGSFAIWMTAALVGILAASGSSGIGIGARLGAFAAIGLVAAAGNAWLSSRAVAPACEALAARIPRRQRAQAGAPWSFAWSLRLSVVALVVSPAILDGSLDRVRALRAAADGILVPGAGAEGLLLPLGLLALGLAMVEGVSSSLRRSAAALRDSARSAAGGGAVTAHAEAELSPASDALSGLASAVRGVVGAFESAAQDLAGELAALDTRRGSVAALAEAQVSDLQGLTESVGSLHSHSESIDASIRALRTAVDESSSAVTELGVAGEQLAGTAGELLASAETVSASIQQALASLGEVAGSTDVLAGVASEASTSMEEMAASMRDVNESAERCSELSDQVVRVADEGSQVVQQTIDGMQAIRDATGTAEGVIRGLGDRAGEIGAIVDVIDGVANETSLLALNAAIIAAQAGEHGRGFSVVVGEIRELATRVSSSTAEISHLIRSVQDESANAIGAIERGTQRVASGVELSEQAGRSLIEITRVARANKVLVEGIVHSVHEQTKAAGHVVGVIEEVSAQADRIRAAARDQQRGSDTVLAQAKGMKEMAKQVHRTADEQSLGTRTIVQTVESIVTGLDRIGTSLKEQTEGCSNAVASTWDAHRRATETSEAVGGLAAVGDRMRAAIESVRGVITDLRG